ncbi:MAG: aldo/keto reductase, partial [Bdellovibrionota bacterium]
MKEKGFSVRTSRLGTTDLTVSRVGFGCYRVHEFEPDHREALKSALLSGVNLIDTSTNYTDGSAERLVGDITRELFDAEQLEREEIVIVTKVGYVQGT